MSTTYSYSAVIDYAISIEQEVSGYTPMLRLSLTMNLQTSRFILQRKRRSMRNISGN